MCWLTSPGFGLGDLIRRPSNEVVGTILCRVFWSRVFLFQLLFFTVYITLLLTIERWVAVVKPSKYGIAFKGKRLTGYLIFCWIWSFLLTGEGILVSVYEPNSSSHDICTVKFIFSGSILRASPNSTQYYHEDVLSVPFHDWSVRTHDRDDKQLPSCVSCEQGQTTRDEERWLEWSVLWRILLICFSPNQLFFFIFATAGKATVDSALHHYIVFLAFTTICANPFIYGLSNADYRQRCKRVCFP